MDLSVRSANRIKNIHVNTVGELTSLDTLDPPHILCSFGNKAEKEIKEKLSELDLRIKMKDEDWGAWEKTHKDLLEKMV